jgi:hypothetical protein
MKRNNSLIKLFMIIWAVFLVVLICYKVNTGKRERDAYVSKLAFKGRVNERIRVKRGVYYSFVVRDSLFTLDIFFSDDFCRNAIPGDSIFKIPNSQFCLLYKKSGEIRPTKF